MARIKAKDLDVEKKLGKKDLKKVQGGLAKGFDPGPVGLRSRGSRSIIDPLFKKGIVDPAFKNGGSKGIVDPAF